jgi:hypothetical protein
MQFQSGVSVEVASVTGVLGAGEEVAVDFGLEDGGDEVGGVVVVAGAIAERVVSPRLVGAGIDAATFVTTGRAWTRTPSHSGPGVPGSIRRSKGVTALPALFAAAELVPDNDGRTVARDAISAAVVLPSVLAPGIDTKPATRNSSARTASVRAKRGRTHSLPPSVASQSR